MVLERYHTQTAMATPYAAAYAAGYYCHYALDAACHPLVNQTSRGNALRHTMIEGAFDRVLRQSGTGHERAPLELPTDSAVYTAAAMGYQYAQPDQYRAALKRFLQASRMLAGLRSNTPAREKYRVTALELQKRMERAVQPCARMVAQLVESMEQGGSAHYLPRANFCRCRASHLQHRARRRTIQVTPCLHRRNTAMYCRICGKRDPGRLPLLPALRP